MIRELLWKFWADDQGLVEATNYIVGVTIMVIGIIVGMVAVRDQVVQEYGDLSLAITNLNQSYSFTVNGNDTIYDDLTPVGGYVDVDGDPPAGIDLTVSASSESNVAPPPGLGEGS